MSTGGFAGQALGSTGLGPQQVRPENLRAVLQDARGTLIEAAGIMHSIGEAIRGSEPNAGPGADASQPLTIEALAHELRMLAQVLKAGLGNLSERL